MERKSIVWIGVFVGSTVGGALPALWGAGMFAYSGLVFSTVGALIGIWIAWKVSEE